MSYEVLARKWRPQTFEDVVGQDHVIQTLKNAIESGRVAHAYLFVGPRGTGKTSTARILAKALNVEDGPSLTFDPNSEICREIAAGNSLDVIEIDGASNNSVDQIRDLRESVGYAPARARFKIYIIDEVHMLSIAAFNALLKTLEEPPAHVKFMFATTEPQKVPATILSRCQRFDLRRIAPGEITRKLQEIAKAEGIDIDEPALLAIARGAEGGLRDAESALDQLIAFRGKTIKEEDVLSVFGLVAWEFLETLAGAMLKGDIKRIIEIVAQLDAHGKDMHRLLIELMEYLRNLMVIVLTDDDKALQNLMPQQLEKLKEQKPDASAERILEMVEILTETETQLRFAISKRTLFETALIRCARAAVVVPIDELIRQINDLKNGITLSEPSATDQAVRSSTSNLTVTAKPKAAAQKDTPPSSPPVSEEPIAPASAPTDIQSLSDRWETVAAKVGELAPLAKTYIEDARPVSLKDGQLTVGIHPDLPDHLEKINYPRNKAAIQKALNDLLQADVTLTFQELDPEDLPDTLVQQDEAEPEETEAPAESSPKKTAKTRQEWLKDPAVRKTLEMFNGDIADIKD